ncbi:MAG: bifunctional phosphoribosylaminoimidazolecarboxamide formyltransferase/IMP cyclohydrolase [Clostridia bacterium]|nr:bifunctional phosphoribosylaminoimidazolecarboxamide formyltransferase/IMP cyclohydrolase [Clostridia bacterium]
MAKKALISVSDKTGIVELAKNLIEFGYEIISTGGTLKVLNQSGVKAVDISSITGFPECLDGRVKTLHPKVHAGLLAMRDNAEHMDFLKSMNIDPIDIVVVNLYPFKETVKKPNIDLQTAIENIDIGGPTMLRSAAKNYQDVAVIVDLADYAKVLEELKNGGITKETKFYLMYKVYQHTSYYDTLIANYLRKKLGIEFPEQFTMAYDKAQDMRYGENPHQNAVFYKEAFDITGSLAVAEQLHGKELSYNNINDTNGALDLLREFSEPTIVAVKHANPCGVATAESISEAFRKANAADPTSIFGGIVASNRTIDKETAEQIHQIFIEIVVAPDFTDEALDILKQKANIRLLKLPTIMNTVPADCYDMKKVLGGLLVQEFDRKVVDLDKCQVVTKLKPTQEQMDDMIFAMKVVKHTKSNAIVVAKDKTILGIGGGQVNRIRATKQAIEHSLTDTKGAVLASDAFFPFDDCVEAANAGGISAILQPGGSVRDQLSIDACDKFGIAMVFSGDRHFKH